MCRRARDPARGHWEVPSGYLEIGETLEQGAARETWEETGLTVDPLSLELCSVVNMTSIAQVAIYFRIEVVEKPTVVAGPECLEVAFMPEQAIPSEQFAWRQSMGSVPERFFNELRSREFTIQFVSIGSNTGVGFRAREYKVESITNTSGDVTGIVG
jgi:ADP-ribose pyrophosphatase YjhB (NUDIX family)